MTGRTAARISPGLSIGVVLFARRGDGPLRAAPRWLVGAAPDTTDPHCPQLLLRRSQPQVRPAGAGAPPEPGPRPVLG